MKTKILIGILLAAVLLGSAPALGAVAPRPSETGPELLQNPGFEGLVCKPGSVPPECLDNWSNNACHDGTFHDNIFTPQGWITWWSKSQGVGQPEVKTIPNVPPFTGELPRIRSGHYAVLFFTFYRLQDNGMYQVVTGLEPGSTVQLTAWAQGWSCDDPNYRPLGYSCGDQYNLSFRVGIEPNGAPDPFSPNIVWSAETWSPDSYGLVGPVTAQVGPGGSVTAILRSTTKWAFKYQDTYWDDASLVMTAGGTAPTDPPPAAPAAPVAPPPSTSTPRPDGSVVHTVKSGETLFLISGAYGVPLDQIRQLNVGSIDGDIIHTGQELVISLPTQPATATPTPEPPASSDGGGGTAGGGENTVGGGSICVSAFHDRNEDTYRDQMVEELLPNAEITLANSTGVINSYITNGLNEPYCFTGLATGSYRVIQVSPPGYTASGSAEWTVGLPSEDTSLDVVFGNVRGGDALPPDEAEEPEDERPRAPIDYSVLSILAKIGGGLLLVACAGMATFYIVNRNRF